MTHERVEEIIRSLPSPLSSEVRRVAGSYLEKDIASDPPRNMIVAVAYDLGIDNPRVLAELSSISAIGGMHSLILDDLVDNRDPHRRPWHDIYLAHVLYVIHHDMLSQVASADWPAHGREASLAAQLDTYAALVEEETLHVGVSTSYSSPDIVWRKCSPAKAVFERVLALAGKYDFKAKVYEAADLACFALCTLDDMLDWPSDYAQLRFTYPVQCALDTIGREWSPGADSELRGAIEAELVYGVTHHRLMSEIIDALERASLLMADVSPNLSAFLDVGMANAVDTWRRHLRYLLTVENNLPTAL